MTMQPFPTSPNAPSPSEPSGDPGGEPKRQPIHEPVPSEPIHAPLPDTPNPGGPANPDVPRVF
jgi:hypothetical protein